MRCQLCEIVTGARPAHVFHESGAAVAFLDHDPAAIGHALIATRAHVTGVLALPAGAAGALFASVLEAMERLSSALEPARLEVAWAEDAPAARHGAHLRVRVVPVFADDLSRARSLGPGPSWSRLAELASKVRRHRSAARGISPSLLVPSRAALLGLERDRLAEARGVSPALARAGRAFPGLREAPDRSCGTPPRGNRRRP